MKLSELIERLQKIQAEAKSVNADPEINIVTGIEDDADCEDVILCEAPLSESGWSVTILGQK